MKLEEMLFEQAYQELMRIEEDCSPDGQYVFALYDLEKIEGTEIPALGKHYVNIYNEWLKLNPHHQRTKSDMESLRNIKLFEIKPWKQIFPQHLQDWFRPENISKWDAAFRSFSEKLEKLAGGRCIRAYEIDAPILSMYVYFTFGDQYVIDMENEWYLLTLGYSD